MLVADNVEHWFTTIFVPETEKCCVDPDKPIVLVLDGHACDSHKTRKLERAAFDHNIIIAAVRTSSQCPFTFLSLFLVFPTIPFGFIYRVVCMLTFHLAVYKALYFAHVFPYLWNIYSYAGLAICFESPLRVV